ncbi:mucin-3A [Clinocottus analis]|uniref:mucin-3A n=1 Tax=Clinocottus analis TaxID=304258 RepID=UPI0035C07058
MESTASTSLLTSNGECEDCHCIMGTCKFNQTLGRCHCHCQAFFFGDKCSFAMNDTPANVDTKVIPTRKANITLKIVHILFLPAYNNLSSPSSLEFISTLELELAALCKEADSETFKKLQVKELTPGCVVAESVAEYIYPNNETQILFVNTQLHGILKEILNNTINRNKISEAFNKSDVLLNELTFSTPEITSIADLEPYVNCPQLANYTAQIVNGQWQCVGPCKTNPDFCHQHGECRNDVEKGPTCRCYKSSLDQFYGPQCELFRHGPGFYGALFGSLAAALLLMIIIVMAVIVKKRHTGIWKTRNSYNRRLSAFEEDFFDFSVTDHDLGL